MQLLNLLVLALASSVSATDDAQDAAVNTGVFVYEHIQFRGIEYQIPALGRCVPLPPNLATTKRPRGIFHPIQNVEQSSVADDYMHSNSICMIPALITGLRQSVPNLHDLRLGDRVAAMRCLTIPNTDL
ncbi:hypothetical protein CCM_02540 [Cordyceps militaris CM01]|uniref:Uncharacterized protein n=1 Tax=Cordyceps militaris (strain CM01) TaxID=983644 RepID=G3JA99_CORMM|nr:uncharacterized protein CCM_02540 [Cordyceps militaris CM01]EGX94269.1 hypothetical protein CCM_02540 [Cordyceps militaris CM01]